MTGPREHSQEKAAVGESAMGGKLPWAAPAIVRLEAGKAEISNDVITDFGTTKS